MAAGVLIVFSVLLTIAAKGGLVGLPLALILTSWFFKYAYILFDHTVWGYEEPPALDIRMLNPLDEQRPLAQLVILGLIYAAVKFAAARLNLAVAVPLAAAAALFLPASVAILGLERNILKAVYPVALGRMVRGLGLMYLWVLAVIGFYALAFALLAKLALWLPLMLLLGMFAVLSVFTALGGALYERRDDLGLEAWRSPERTAERANRAELAASEAAVTEAYGLMRVGSHAKAWALLQGWLASRGHSLADYHWLCDRLSAWNDPRHANRMTEEYVERLISLKRDGEALEVVARRLEEDASFRPKSAAATLRLARLAAEGGGAPRIARALLADFGRRFAGNPGIAAAERMAKELGNYAPLRGEAGLDLVHRCRR